MSNEKSGRIIVISGPSGVGKTAVCEAMVKLPHFTRAVTCTTRPPRSGERDGEHYRFLSRDEFESGLRRGEFLEHATVHGHLYGTPRKAVEEAVGRGENVLLAIDVQGAEKLRKAAEEEERGVLTGRLTTIFLLPPDEATLERRLKERGTERDEKLSERLRNARREIGEKDRYDSVIVNDTIDDTVRRVLEHLETSGVEP